MLLNQKNDNITNMTEIKTAGNSIVCIFSGVLDGTEVIDIPVAQLSNKEIQLIGKNVTDWNTDFVLLLFNIFKHVPKDHITCSQLPQGLVQLFRLALQTTPKEPEVTGKKLPFLENVGVWGISIWSSIKKGGLFVCESAASWGRQLCGRAVYRSKDFWLVLADCGPKSIAIVSLISFMVGLILSFVSAIQLKTFGAQIYVASLVTIAMTRIMGAIMTGIIMAGRTGASYAATIGTMQVNEELDALQTMGISRTDFLVLPRINALLLAMPILVLLADFMGVLGGCCVCVLFWDIPLAEYIRYSTNSFSVVNFLVGVFHGLVFGFIIALCGCYFGVNCGRNADSVGTATTNAVVYSIVWMIIMTGLLTVILNCLGV